MQYTHIANPVRAVGTRILDVTDITTREEGCGQSCPDLMLRLADGRNYKADTSMTCRYVPVPGDYLVRQEDGYEYLNPKDVFERKYRELPIIPQSMEEVLSFEQFVEHGRDITGSTEARMPWSFTFRGHPVTHENDQCYLVGGHPQVRFTTDDVLIIDTAGVLATRPIYQQRVLDQANAAASDLAEVLQFIETPRFASLTLAEKDRVCLQADTLMVLETILRQRIAGFPVAQS